MIKQLSVKEFANLDKSKYQILDVREVSERNITHIDGILIPLQTLPTRLAELNKDLPTVVYCRSGMRSQNACEYLESVGFQDLSNLSGGILAYADIDSSIIKY